MQMSIERTNMESFQLAKDSEEKLHSQKEVLSLSDDTDDTEMSQISSLQKIKEKSQQTQAERQRCREMSIKRHLNVQR